MANNTEYVRTSFLNHVQDNLETSYTVRWPGTQFDTTAQDKWIEPTTLGFSPEPINASGPKRVERWTFQVSCFARVGTSGGSIYDVDELADAVIDEFRWLELDVVDWSQGQGGSTVGTLYFLQPDSTPVGADEAAGADHVSVTLPAVFDDLEV